LGNANSLSNLLIVGWSTRKPGQVLSTGLLIMVYVVFYWNNKFDCKSILMFYFEVIQNANPVMIWSYNPHEKKTKSPNHGKHDRRVA
jgi:hypothetical protein